MICHSVSDCSLASSFTVDRPHSSTPTDKDDLNASPRYTKVTFDLRQNIEYETEHKASPGLWFSGSDFNTFKQERDEDAKATQNSLYARMSKMVYQTFSKHCALDPCARMHLEKSLNEDVVGLPVKAINLDRKRLRNELLLTIAVEDYLDWDDKEVLRAKLEYISLLSRLFAQELASAVANHVQRMNNGDSNLLACF
jgi:hypothetical protein